MSVVSSRFVLEHVQIDGRRYVQEYHTDDQGVVHKEGYYLAAVGTDYNAVMLARAPQIEWQLVEAEIAQERADDEDSAQAKLDVFLAGDEAKRAIGLSDDELKVVRGD